MKSLITTLMLLLSFSVSLYAGGGTPQFKHYKVQESNKGNNLNYAINNGKPTFAGIYLVTSWGCGAGGCNTGVSYG